MLQHEKYFDITDAALSFDHRADYAERRSFFEAEPLEKANKAKETTTSQSSPETAENQSSETTASQSSPETTAATSTDVTNTQKETAAAVQKQDNAPLIIVTIFLSAGIIALIFIIGRNRKNGSN